MKVALLASMALVTSCVSEPDPADVVIETLDAISVAYCEHLAACGVAAPEFTLDGCTSTRMTPAELANLREDLASGRIVWVQELADRCLEAIAADTCPIEPAFFDWGLDDPDACRGYFSYTP